MGNILNPQELLKIAVNVEINGKKLYENLEKKSSNQKAKFIWKYLKEQEEIHKDTFQKMLDEAGEYIVFESTPGEHEAFLKAEASEYVFTGKLIEEKTKTGFKTDKEAVDFGIYIEKESILAYTALRDYIKSSKLPALDRIIDEEKKHLVDLVVLKDNL